MISLNPDAVNDDIIDACAMHREEFRGAEQNVSKNSVFNEY